MQTFELKIKQIIEKVTQKHLPELCKTWNTLFGHQNEESLVIQLEEHYSMFLQAIVNENAEKETKIRHRIENLNKEKICIGTMLKEEIVLDVDPDMPLYNLYKESNAQLGFYRQKLHHRREEVRNLHQEVADVCAALGEPPIERDEENLPSEAEMTQLREFLSSKRKIEVDRCSLIKQLQTKAKLLLIKLESTEVHRELIDSESLKPSLENIMKLEALAKSLEEEVANQSMEIADMLARLQVMWKSLDVPANTQNRFKNIEAYGRSTCEKLRLEVERCEKLELKILPLIIERLRLEILDKMDKCKKPDKFRCRSVVFEAIVYNSNALRRHESELMYLNTFLMESEKVFKLLEERDGLKQQVEAMESDQPDTKKRFQNRGGFLLKQAQEKKDLERKVLKAEVALVSAVDEFAVKCGEPITVHGVAINLDRTAKSRLMMKKQVSSTELRLKKPFGNSTNI